MKSQVKVTLVPLTDGENAQHALARMDRWFRRASDHGGDLIVCPEHILGRKVPAADRNVRRCRDLTREHGLDAIAGPVEAHGSRFAATALMVDGSGSVLGGYIKSHPASGKLPHYWPPVDGGGDEAWRCTYYLGAEEILWTEGRNDYIEDFICPPAVHANGCVVAASISNGYGTGFAEPRSDCIDGEGRAEETRLFPRIKTQGEACVSATIDLAKPGSWSRHLRQMHQRRPAMHGALIEPATSWQDYPDVPWDEPEYEQLVKKAQLQAKGSI